MIKIFIQIKDNKLLFSIRKRLNSEQKSLINTNVINNSELVFSSDYILENKKILTTFIKELCESNNINNVFIKEYEIAPLVIELIKDIKIITNLYLLQESSLTYKICESILNTNYINYISVYNLQEFMLELLDKENIKVESRSEILYSSNFMTSNYLDKFSTLYYKITIYIKFPLTGIDSDDLYSFLKINRYLRYIHINQASIEEIDYLIKLLIKNNYKNIKIIIDDNIEDNTILEYLKKQNKNSSKNNNIKFKINYSKDYLEKNLPIQLRVNTIRVCVLIILMIVSFFILDLFYDNYTSMKSVNEINEDISKILDLNDTEVKIDNPKITPPEGIEKIYEINEEYAKLLELNKDTVGWIKINNTNVDYPVVQAKDNKYYLTKNFYKQNDSGGWIYMDYRNNIKEFSDNTIIFGHNMYYSGTMFGTLYKTKNASWYKSEENQTITFNTLYENIEWKIFSIYVTPVTNDYLISDFSTRDKFQDFIDMIIDRSIYDFNVPVLHNDKILTITTCAKNGTNRLVIHAVKV